METNSFPEQNLVWMIVAYSFHSRWTEELPCFRTSLHVLVLASVSTCTSTSLHASVLVDIIDYHCILGSAAVSPSTEDVSNQFALQEALSKRALTVQRSNSYDATKFNRIVVGSDVSR